MQTTGMTNKHTAPALFPVAWKKMESSGPAVDVRTSSRLFKQKRRMIRNTSEVPVPIRTASTIALGA